MYRELSFADALVGNGLLDERFGKACPFVPRKHPARYVAAVDINDFYL